MSGDAIERARAWVGSAKASNTWDSGCDIITDLLAIVDRLPVTADKVRVVPGMELWTYERFTELPHRPPFMVKVKHVWEPKGGADCGEADAFGRVTNKLCASLCYSTRAAAEEARKTNERE